MVALGNLGALMVCKFKVMEELWNDERRAVAEGFYLYSMVRVIWAHVRQSNIRNWLTSANFVQIWQCVGFPGGSMVMNLPANAGATGDMHSVPGSGRSPGGRNGSPLQYSCLENSMDREAWRAAVYGVMKSWTRQRLITHAWQYIDISVQVW